MAANIAAAVGIQQPNTSVSRSVRLVAPDPAILILAVIALVYFARNPNRSCARIVKETNIDQVTMIADDDTSLTLLHHGDEASAAENDTKTNQATKERNSELQSKQLEEIALVRERRVLKSWALNTWTVFLTAAAGIIVPSLLSAFYLLEFLCVCTCWSARRNTHSQDLNLFRISLLIFSGIHLCLFYLYQFQYSQTILNDTDFTAR